MGRRGVDDDGRRILHQRHRVQRGGVGETEERDVSLVQGHPPRFDVLPELFGNNNELKVAAILEPLANAKTCRSGRAVNEDFLHSHSIVAGGFGVMSQTTRFAPFTFVAIFSATMVTNLNGSSTMPAFTNCFVEIARMPIT